MSAATGTTPSVLTRSKEDLPHPNSKKAPKTFTGRHTEVDSFLTEFVEMTNLYNVPTLGRFDVITRYVSRSVAEVMEGLPEYHAKNWIDFVTQMKDLYNHVKVEKTILSSRSRHLRRRQNSQIYPKPIEIPKISAWFLSYWRLAPAAPEDHRRSISEGILDGTTSSRSQSS